MLMVALFELILGCVFGAFALGKTLEKVLFMLNSMGMVSFLLTDIKLIY